MAGAWQHAASISSRLKPILLRMLPPAFQQLYTDSPSQPQNVAPLNFPEVTINLPELLQLGISQDRANLLCSHFVNAIRRVDETLYENYRADSPKFLGNSATLSSGSRSAYVQAIQDHLMVVRSQTIARLWDALLSQAQVIANQARSLNQAHAETTPIPPSSSCASKRKRQGRPSPFTPEQTFALNALLARDDQFSSEDKEFIAHQLNLTRDQVNRWFCNARARKKSGCRPPPRSGSPASVRTTSSDLTSTQSHPTDQVCWAQTDPQGMLQEATTPGFIHPTPGLTDSTSEINTPSNGGTTPALEADSLDVYLSYSACLEPEQGPSGVTHNLASQQDQIARWSENVNTTGPIITFSSSVEPQGAVTSDASICPQPQGWACDGTSFSDPSFDPLSFSSVQPLSTLHSPASEYTPSDDLFPGFDLSQW